MNDSNTLLPDGIAFKGRGPASHIEPAETYAGLREETKFCPMCGERRPKRDFYSSRKAKKLLAYCRPCDNSRKQRVRA